MHPLFRLFPLTAVLLFAENALAQQISVSLRGESDGSETGGFVSVDSANWSDAWIEINGRPPGISPLTKADFSVSNGLTNAQIVSLDSETNPKYPSHLAVSFVLDNSSSMFHAYDSLTNYCDSILRKLPEKTIAQAVTFDITARSESHLYTNRSSVFIAQSGFRDSTLAVSRFWHFFDTIRTRYTPLYDAITAAVSTIDARRHAGAAHEQLNDVLLVVTDGEDNASRIDIETLYDVVRTAHVRLFTVNFRTGEDARLEWLAHHVGGESYYASDLSDLQSVLSDIGISLTRRYRIRYRFPSLTPTGSGK